MVTLEITLKGKFLVNLPAKSSSVPRVGDLILLSGTKFTVKTVLWVPPLWHPGNRSVVRIDLKK